MDGGVDFYDWIFAAFLLAGSMGGGYLAILSWSSFAPIVFRVIRVI